MNASQIIQLLLAVLNNLPALEQDGEDLASALKAIFSSSAPPTGAELLALLQQAQTTDAQIETTAPITQPPIVNPQGPSEQANQPAPIQAPEAPEAPLD